MKKEFKTWKKRAGAMLGLGFFILAGCGNESTSTGPALQNTVVMVTPTEIFPAYSGEVQGVLLSLNHDSKIYTTSLPANRSLIERAFELDQLVRCYPPGTTFIVFGASVPGREGLPLVLKTKAGRILVGPDSGVFTRILEREEAESYCRIEAPKLVQKEGLNSMFPERDVYAPVAAQLAQGAAVDSFGPMGVAPVRIPIPRATVAAGSLNGEVLYTNWTGRVVTSFRTETFQKVRANDLIRLNVGGKMFSVPYLMAETDAPPGRPFGICNADGFFEIAILDANAAQILKLAPGQKITIR